MKLFKYEVSDGFFPQTLEGEIEAATIQEADEQLREIYASELDTTEEELQVKIREVI